MKAPFLNAKESLQSSQQRAIFCHFWSHWATMGHCDHRSLLSVRQQPRNLCKNVKSCHYCPIPPITLSLRPHFCTTNSISQWSIHMFSRPQLVCISNFFCVDQCLWTNFPFPSPSLFNTVEITYETKNSNPPCSVEEVQGGGNKHKTDIQKDQKMS